MDVFQLRKRLVEDYGSYVESFIKIQDHRIEEEVRRNLEDGLLWPEPLIQLNPSFEVGETVDELVGDGSLHEECARVFRVGKGSGEPGKPMRLHRHQSDAVRVAGKGENYVLTTGTGSGKSLAYIIPIVDYILRRGPGKGIQAIVVYPMNALANSQFGELEKFLCSGYPDGRGPVTFARYTGQESDEERQRIIANPPDILLTNYVMLELILTRQQEQGLVRGARDLGFLVFDELHTYRGRQGADVAFLIRRVRDLLAGDDLRCVGTSATIAGSGTYEEQQKEISTVASRLFGASVKPESVIGETLRRATPHHDLDDVDFIASLTERLNTHDEEFPKSYDGFVRDPLSVWIESSFGIHEDPVSGRLVRARPSSVSGTNGAAAKLASLTGVDVESCARVIRAGLLAGYECDPDPDTGRTPFAFRLHQFFSRGDAVYASIEPESDRYITLKGQQFVPGDRNRLLMPLAFCRECGQEYYPVRATANDLSDGYQFLPRTLSDTHDDESSEAGFLFFSTSKPWPSEGDDEFWERIPSDWQEEHRGYLRVRKERRRFVPRPVNVGADGIVGPGGLDAQYFPAPFRFCLSCGISYATTLRSDFTKLGSLGSEGRSTATTILGLSGISSLRGEESLRPEARKILSFTDNRQDASLQAGHFNDFVEIGLLRSALHRATRDAGTQGLAHDLLTEKVFAALDLPLEQYASNPSARFKALADTQGALKDVLGYRLYRDLERGWRITAPNLEQSGLLKISYESLDELCAADDVWQDMHPALVTAAPETREKVSKVLLDDMRRRLAIKVDYLDLSYWDRIVRRSSQNLIPPWAIDETEIDKPAYASVVFPRPQRKGDPRENAYISARGGFGQYLRRFSTFEDFDEKPSLEETGEIIHHLLRALTEAGIVEMVSEAAKDDVPGYQVQASAMLWAAGDGTEPFNDPIRTPDRSDAGDTNRFFVDFYRETAPTLNGLEAREHTAQVPYEVRERREQDFREGRLPILFCSPTMELGVDISELNAVNLRNVPPTPANYAQRSGRAGRSGQPALVYAYCSIGSSHDQYFFKRPERMVAGAVSPPRLDLVNEDLVRSHVHAIWLTETGQSLGRSLKDVLDVDGENPSLAMRDWVRDSFAREAVRRRAKERAVRVLASVEDELQTSTWYADGWLDDVLEGAERSFDRACERWRTLYRAASEQVETQHRIVNDASRSQKDKKQAARLRAEAEAQRSLLTSESEWAFSSDFYSYRYFASEGFLPGYSFPRLPISAYIPGSGRRNDREEFLQRPRFLAISEFGPRASVYHEGARYLINRVILERDAEDVLTSRAKQCENCGYFHPIPGTDDGPDLCELCGSLLGPQMQSLFRLQNVSTTRRDRINSDEEERQRLGYELRTGVRFADRGDVSGDTTARTATVTKGGRTLARLTYGSAATLWRVNLGWTRRKNKDQLGFVLDTERGFWAKTEQESAEDPQAPLSARTRRVIPYVEDTRNCLLFRLEDEHPPEVMASLQSALKNAIQVAYQLEDSELAAEPLPSRQDRRQILLYESAEGGAGALRRLLDDPASLARVAAEALDICHFDPDGTDREAAPGSGEVCEAACYDCLMTYTNQMDHRSLDRKSILNLLLDLKDATVEAAPSGGSRPDHLAALTRQTGSELERKWLRFMDASGLRLPTHAQLLIEEATSRPDFFYADGYDAAIYIDGPHHDYPERKSRDAAKTTELEDLGYMVIRFGHEDDWEKILKEYPYVFGMPERPVGNSPVSKTHRSSTSLLELFDSEWHPLVESLSALDGAELDGGIDICEELTPVGVSVAEVSRGGKIISIVDSRDPDIEHLIELIESDGVTVISTTPDLIEETVASVVTALGE